MATLLCIETATTNCSVALSVNGNVIALKEDYNNSYSHAERLHVYMEELLTKNNISISQLSAIAVSKGPGSYTGLRIGVSAAKGLCFALEIPLISIPTLDSLAHQVLEKEGVEVKFKWKNEKLINIPKQHPQLIPEGVSSPRGVSNRRRWIRKNPGAR